MLKTLQNSFPFMNKYFSGIATVFMLHRVHPINSNKLSPNENMKVSPEFLDKFITNLKLQGYEFISLDRLYEILQKGENVKKQIIFTLDDGYKDNYEIAYPIFKKHKIPFTIYLSTSFPENNALLWWYVLEDLILENDVLKLSNGRNFICQTKEQKENTFLKIREIILGFKKEFFLKSLHKLFENYTINWFSENTKFCMNWEQVTELSKDPLVIIAGHTKNHYALNQLSVKEVKSEILEANELIENKIGKKIEHFAYPFGSSIEIGQREFGVVKNLEFKTSTTTRIGNIYHEHRNYLECLPRIMLTENFDIKDIGKIRRNKVVTL